MLATLLLAEAFAQHLATVRAHAPAGFTVVAAPPFVVIGDEPPERVRARAAGTVGWAVSKLKADFFTRDPERPLEVWLFANDASYRKWAKALFGDDPDTPYGYYSPTHHALIMNISTGGGTLVHEIVHPYMDANFPARPPWLNEGLGSLYEQAAERDGHIIGLPNWRLPELQHAIRAGKVPSFEWLLGLGEDDFYRHDRGTNYGQARYLLYYLQEKGLLRDYYRRFAANHERDPSGVETLRAVLGERDLAAFKKRWEAFVLTLHFGED
jgi:hypothetical protein